MVISISMVSQYSDLTYSVPSQQPSLYSGRGPCRFPGFVCGRVGFLGGEFRASAVCECWVPCAHLET